MHGGDRGRGGDRRAARRLLATRPTASWSSRTRAAPISRRRPRRRRSRCEPSPPRTCRGNDWHSEATSSRCATCSRAPARAEAGRGGRARRPRRRWPAACWRSRPSTRPSGSARARCGSSVAPLHHGALDLYVPLVDWGVRFDAVRFPARLQADLRAVDRQAVKRYALGGSLDLAVLRHEARDAIAGYLKLLIVITTLSAAALGVLVALAAPQAPRTPRPDRRRHRARAGRRARRPPPAARSDRRSAVLRARRRHPARARRRRVGRALEPRDRPGARRAARRPRAAGRRPRPPPAAGRAPGGDDRLRPAQQRARALEPRARRPPRPGPLPGRPDRPRHAARDEPRQPHRAHRPPVRLRLGQPRLGHARALARAAGRDRAHPVRSPRDATAPTARSINDVAGLQDRRLLATRSSAARARTSPTATTTRRRPRCRTPSPAGCSRCSARSTSSWSTSRR